MVKIELLLIIELNIKHQFQVRDKMKINVYTDGACSNNGRSNAKAGLGIYFGEGDPRNSSERIIGKQTNNTAELTAILRAAAILQEDIMDGDEIHIYTDSDYAKRCCTTYGEKLAKKGWGIGSKKPIPNLELVQKAYTVFSRLDNVYFHYIAAHTGLDDEHSRGNEGADRLANLAIGVSECPYANKSKKLGSQKKIYINLPYAEKDEGKKLGTRWDPKKKKWYILPSLDEYKKKIILNRWAQI
jgi:ribonuclease HI